MGLIEMVRTIRAACAAINAEGDIQPPINLKQRDKQVIQEFITVCTNNSDMKFPQIAATIWEALPDAWLADASNIPNTEDAPDYSPCAHFGKQGSLPKCKDCGAHAVDEYLRCQTATVAQKAAAKAAQKEKGTTAPKQKKTVAATTAEVPTATVQRSRYGHSITSQVGIIDDMLFNGAYENAMISTLLTHFDTTEEKCRARIQAHVKNIPHSRGIQVTIIREDGKSIFYKTEQKEWCGSVTDVQEAHNIIDDRRTVNVHGTPRQPSLRHAVRNSMKDSGEKPIRNTAKVQKKEEPQAATTEEKPVDNPATGTTKETTPTKKAKPTKEAPPAKETPKGKGRHKKDSGEKPAVPNV